MNHQEIRRSFFDFFKVRGHKVVPSSSLLPTDPSVLFATAGMQQFKPYYTGQLDAQKDFGLLNTASIQKCLRTSDIDEVGDESHLTFFEMLGNFSFGGYWKKEAIEYAYEFITDEMGLKIDYVSVFGGEGDVPADEESKEIWKMIAPNIEVKKFGRNDNFWGPTGNEGPCGPTTEIYVNGVEVWNLVFNQYYQHKDEYLENLKVNGIDTGMGMERLAMAAQKKENIFETDLFEPLMKLLPVNLNERLKRVIADHARAIVFLISDGVKPSNKEQGYILRRLMRRIIVYISTNNLSLEMFENIFSETARNFGKFYPELDISLVTSEFRQENEKFQKTVARGLKELEKLDLVTAASAFHLYESYGLPFEVIKEMANAKANSLTRDDFDKEFKKHQIKSKEGSEKKFGGHGLILDTGELKAGNPEELKKVIRLHTATHLLQAALRKILGNEAKQAGSDITAERLRFDFTFPRKVTPDELEQVENLVNSIVSRDLKVIKETMSFQDAIKEGALSFFKEKYPETVSVYTVADEGGEIFSKELCGGPHVGHTGEIGRVKIIKEESLSAGTRRIRAIVENI